MSFHLLNHHNKQDWEHFQLSTHSLTLGSWAVLSVGPPRWKKWLMMATAVIFKEKTNMKSKKWGEIRVSDSTSLFPLTFGKTKSPWVENWSFSL